MILTTPPLSSAALYTGLAYIQIGELTITQGQVVNGVTWNFEPVDGWDVPAAVTERADQRNADHGGWLKRSYFTARDLELKGTLLGQDWSALEQSWNLLKSVVPSFDSFDLTVAQPGAPVLTASVVQDSKPLVNQNNAEWEFSFSLIAVDPRRYSVDVTTLSTGLPTMTGGLALPLSLPLSIGATMSSGVLSISNLGDSATRPVLTVSGPCPPCSISHGSRRLVVRDAVPAGRALTLDTDARTALLDGTASRVVTGTWFELEPGQSEIQFSSASYDPDARLTASFRSAWR